MSALTIVLDRHPASAGEARRRVRDLLTNELPSETVDVVELLVSEVVTNAVLHATTPPELRLDLLADRVRVEVHDADYDRPPKLRANADPAATSGRGLAIVDALANSWGVDTDDGIGKTVWFEVLVDKPKRRRG